MSKFVFMVVLLAWAPTTGDGTPDSGHFSDPTLSLCHQRTQAFSKKHNTPLQLCVRISKKGYAIIAAEEIDFVFSNGGFEVVEDDKDVVIARLRLALKKIGRLHVGKTRDSQKVRAIIKGVK